MRISYIVMLSIIILSLLLSAAFYAQLPQMVASHWDAQGEVDGYMSKFWGLFLMPLLLVALAILFAFIPRIDPLRENIEQFRRYYDGFIIVFYVFMFAIHLQILLWNLGIHISPNVLLPVGLGLLVYYCGILCENAKRNWFIGIRTPWTLSNQTVWDKTHKIGGKLFKIAGIVALIGIFFQRYALYFILVPIFVVSCYTVIYSYVAYRKETKA